MTILETRYKKALEKIGTANLLALPEQVKEILKSTTDLKIKVEMLELIAESGFCTKEIPCCGCKEYENCEKKKY